MKKKSPLDRLQEGLAPLNEMTRIGRYNYGNFEVIVRDEGGKFKDPSFHLKNKHDEWELALWIKDFRIFEIAKGRNTGFKKGELLANSILNPLKQFLNSLDDEDPKNPRTYWRTLLVEWNKNNELIKVDIEMKMPYGEKTA